METAKLKEEIVDCDIRSKYLKDRINEIEQNLQEYSQDKANYNIIQNVILLFFPLFAAIIDVLLGGTAIGKLLESVPIQGLRIIKIFVVSITIVTVELGLGLLLDYLSNQREKYAPPYKVFKVISYAFLLGIPFLASTDVFYLSKNIDNPFFETISFASKLIQYIAFVVLSLATHFYLLFNAKRITSSFANMRKYLLFLFYSRRKQSKIEEISAISTKMFGVLTTLTLIDSNFRIDEFPITETTRNSYNQFYKN